MFWVGLVVLITHALEAITGFGCTVLALPFVVELIGLEKARILLAILALILAIYISITNIKKINFKEYFIILLLSGIGMPIGIYLFNNLDAFWLKKILAVFIIIASIIQLIKIFSKKDEELASGKLNILYYFLLFAGGIVHGAFASGGPLIVLYAAKKLKDKSEFRATLCLLWTTLNSILIFSFYHANKLNASTSKDLLYLMPFLIIGIITGEIIHRKVNALLFKKIVFITLLFVGVVMVFLK